MTPPNSNVIPFSPSRFAPMDKPIARVRQDRNWRELERSRPVQPGWKRALHWFGVIGFFAIALTLAVS